MYERKSLKKYSSLTDTIHIFRFWHTFTLVVCQLISGHDNPFTHSFNIYRMNETQSSNEWSIYVFFAFDIYQTNNLYCSKAEFDTSLNDFESEVLTFTESSLQINILTSAIFYRNIKIKTPNPCIQEFGVSSLKIHLFHLHYRSIRSLTRLWSFPFFIER